MQGHFSGCHLWVAVTPWSRAIVPCTLWGQKKMEETLANIPSSVSIPPWSCRDTLPSPHLPFWPRPHFLELPAAGWAAPRCPIPMESPPFPSPAMQHITSHPPVDGIGAVVVEKLRAGRLWEGGVERGRVEKGPLQTDPSSTAPPMSPKGMAPAQPKAGPDPCTWQWGN